MKASLLHCATATLLIFLGASALRAEQLYVTDGTSLTRFDTSAPRLVVTKAITGLQIGETIVDIDLRPTTSEIYGVGSTNRLYVINGATGAATLVGTTFVTSLNGTKFGVDFNPSVDRVRLVSDTEQSMRINPNTGAVTAVDTSLSPAGSYVSVAYSNNFATSTSTQLFVIDSAAGQLALIGGPNGSPSPNLGAVTAIGSLGLGTNLNANIGFDISAATGLAYASILVGGKSNLYTINFLTGATTKIATIADGKTPYCGLTAGPDLPLPTDQAPTVKIKGGKVKKTKKQTIRLTGTASDDFAVAAVEYSTNGKTFLPARGKAKWSITLKLTKRVTKVTVRAVDDVDATSKVAKVTVRRKG